MRLGLEGLFVGRRPELTLLDAQFEEVQAGHPRVVLIEGLAGIGKTALVERFLGQCSDARVVRASGEESEVLLAYGVIDQLFHAAVPDAPPKGRAIPLEDNLSVGAQLLDVLGSLQERGPVIVAVEDVHWADQLSLKVLLFALRRLLIERVMVLLVLRQEEGDGLPEGLHRLIRDRGGTTLQLRGLQVADLHELAQLQGLRPFSARAAQRLHEHTQGNPLHAQALLDEVPADAWGTLDVSLPAPRSFSLVVLGRRGRCSQVAQHLVDAASILGMHCSLETAARLAGIGDPLLALEEASAAQLLQGVEQIGGRAIGFPHPLVRAAIYHGMDAVERIGLHGRAAELVGDEASALRHRVAAAWSSDPQLAAQLANFAQQEKARGSWASAAVHLGSASRLSPDSSGKEQLLLEAVNWMLFAGDDSQATTFTEEISTFAGSASRDSVLGKLAVQNGRPDKAEGLLRGAWQQCNPSTEPELAVAIALQSALHAMARLRAGEGTEWARRALPLSIRSSSLMVPVAESLISLGLALQGDMVAAHRALGRLEGIGQAAAGDWPQLVRGILMMLEDDLSNACTDLALAATTALQRGSLNTAASAFAWLARAEYYVGDWDGAIVHAERVALLTAAADRPYKPFSPSAAVAVSAARGDWVLAEEQARVVVGNDSGYEAAIVTTAVAAAELASARADHAGVLSALGPLLDLRHRDGIDAPGVWRWQDLYADALVSLGRPGEADTFLRPHEALATASGRRSMMARLARVRGRIKAAEGQTEGAAAIFVTALAHIEQLPMPFERARIQLTYGSFLRRLGRRRDAATQLLAAQASLMELEAEPYLEQCDRELAACGLTPRRRRGADRTRLTPQELSVARLVASGLTNREVAAELFLSTKTIEFHLSQIFTKLDITSRRQIGQHSSWARPTAPDI